MIKRKNPLNILVLLLALVVLNGSVFAQEENLGIVFKNQVSTNLMLPVFESFDLTYERTIANKWALGLAGAIYGARAAELATGDNYFEYKTNYEVMPFVRVYFQGAQNKSHFVEIFGSLSEAEERGRAVRSVNEEGFGVYAIGTRIYTVGGLGAGYGYRFLLLQKRLVLEAQFGIRTNFEIDFILLNAAIVRTGIKVGYRF
jgi:hypothetical protein